MRRALLVIGIVGLGCGGSGSKGGGGGGPLSTSVPGNKTIGSLTPSEQTQLCKDIDRWSQTAFTPTLCKTSAVVAAAFAAAFDDSLTDAQIQMTCTQAYNQCVSSSQSPDGGAGATCQVGAGDPTCMATVSEVSACLSDDSAALAQASNSLPSCSSLTKASLSSMSGGGDQDAGTTAGPASCQTVTTKCPNFSMPSTPNAFRP